MMLFRTRHPQDKQNRAIHHFLLKKSFFINLFPHDQYYFLDYPTPYPNSFSQNKSERLMLLPIESTSLQPMESKNRFQQSSASLLPEVTPGTSNIALNWKWKKSISFRTLSLTQTCLITLLFWIPAHYSSLGDPLSHVPFEKLDSHHPLERTGHPANQLLAQVTQHVCHSSRLGKRVVQFGVELGQFRSDENQVALLRVFESGSCQVGCNSGL